MSEDKRSFVGRHTTAIEVLAIVLIAVVVIAFSAYYHPWTGSGKTGFSVESLEAQGFDVIYGHITDHSSTIFVNDAAKFVLLANTLDVSIVFLSNSNEVFFGYNGVIYLYSW